MLEEKRPRSGPGGDVVHVAELELRARIGVSDHERAEAQRLTVSLTLWPATQFGDLQDEIEDAVDYAKVVQEVQALAIRRVDRLLETLAEAMALHLLATFPITRVRVELRKFVLADARYAAVMILRESTTNP
ncbi:MAG: dihydroneopterin aldolase [Chthoniobacterales bacterium]